MTIDHNGITKIPLIANDTGCARVAQTTNIPASSVKNVRIRVSNTRANYCALLQPINLLKRYTVLLPHCLINNSNTYTHIKVINPSVNQITLPPGFIIGSSSIVEDSDMVQLYDNVEKEREVNDLS